MNTELMDDVISVAEDIQKEAHGYIEWIMEENMKKGKSVSYHDAFYTWLYLRLAAIEIRLNEMVKAEGV